MPAFRRRQYASAFNQPLSFDTSSVTSMDRMFDVRSSPCPAPHLRSPLLHAACIAVVRLPTRASCACVAPACQPPPASQPGRGELVSHHMCPPRDSAGCELPVRRQQAAHSLRRWSWLELGFGDLPAAASVAASITASPLTAAAKPAASVASAAIAATSLTAALPIFFIHLKMFV